MALPLLVFILGTLGVVVVYRRSGQPQRRHLPPGPKKLPFIGSVLSMPSKAEWETFAKWGKEYSLCLIPAQYSSHALHRLRHYSRQRFRHIYYHFEFVQSRRQPPRQQIRYLLRQVSSSTSSQVNSKKICVVQLGHTLPCSTSCKFFVYALRTVELITLKIRLGISLQHASLWRCLAGKSPDVYKTL
jgi:hypothetical protein